MLTRRWATGRDGGFTLITIRNYDHYQSLPIASGDGARDGAHPDARDGARDGAGDGGRDGGRDISKKYQEGKDGERAHARANGWEGIEAGPVQLTKDHEPAEAQP
jgi:hypothetical protein